jgi:predicted permease
LESAKLIIFQIGVMFILIAFGAGVYKFGIISKRANKQLSNFVVSVVSPVLIFTAYQKEFDTALLKGLLISFLIAAVSHMLLILSGKICVRTKNNSDYNIERFAIAYSNCGFMGIPLIESIYGSDGVLYLTAYITMFNIFMWTHGVSCMKKSNDFRALAKALLSPAIIATAAGLIMFVCRIALPGIILQPMRYIASLNTPLAMIVSGITFAQSDLKGALAKPRIYLVSVLKLLIVPVIVMLIFKPFGFSDAVLNTSVIATACPTAASTIMFSYKYGGNAVYASEIFALTTLMSAITLPLVLIISNFV